MIRKISRPTGLVLTAFFSFAVLTAFYGNLFTRLNRVCFASGGDGMQSYVNMDYHIRYDSTYMRCNSMNYPYGEHVFFTNNQPLISNTLRFISRNIADVSEYTLGILNFTMLFCLVISPLILYLILTFVGVGPLVSAIAAVAITYLSPQLDRFGGHFNLSYVCAIPLMIYLLIRFFKTPTFKFSIFIFLTVLAGALTHFYFYGFFAILILFFYGTYLIRDDLPGTGKGKMLLHFFFQLVLPFLILQAFYLSDHVTDRPAYPWGFLYYRAYPQSVFLATRQPYGRLLYPFFHWSYIDWEGYEYVGLLATLATLFFLFTTVRKLLNRQGRQILTITPVTSLNILFWASLAALLYSFGLPFILGLQKVVDLIGPVRQMRGIARFVWLYYYVMNLIAVFWVWDAWVKKKKFRNILLIVLALLILLFDSYYQVRGRGQQLENHIPGLVDWKLTSPENQWIHRVPLHNFQAIIPVPYFHVGSENVWIDGACDIVTQNFIAVDRSGLPSMGVMLSRTSISQTIANIALMLGSTTAVKHMDRFPDTRPFLLMAARCSSLNAFEKELIRHAWKIDSSGNFILYRLEFNSFRTISDSIRARVSHTFQYDKLNKAGIFRTTGNPGSFVLVDYDNQPSLDALSGAGCYTGVAKRPNIVFDGKLPETDTAKSYTFSFWVRNVRRDLYPRTRMLVQESDTSHQVIQTYSEQIFRLFKDIEGDWALVTFPFTLKDRHDPVRITLQNETLRNKPLWVDNLLIRPASDTVYWSDSSGIWRNDRHW